ncbi:MAG: polysaccharide biosynthesis/export family protein [Chitinispirillaceae bacterium]|nr:polysaccharide biosynthesis/export family protein [Chitinispirillaceae bacterium]
MKNGFDRRYLCIMSIIMALASSGIFLGHGEIVPEISTGVYAPSETLLPPKSAVYPSAMDLPLSTWVGPGDAIQIKAYPDTTSFISGVYTIFDSGVVVLPILGFVQVTSMSITGLTKQLTDAYARYMAHPSVQVEPMIHLLLLGGFLRPGTHLVNPLHPFSNVLRSAGGTVRDDGLKLLRWERGGKVLSSNLTAEAEETRSLWALGFKSGDQLCVTLRTERDILQVASFIVSTVITSGTLVLTLLVFLK